MTTEDVESLMIRLTGELAGRSGKEDEESVDEDKGEETGGDDRESEGGSADGSYLDGV